MKSTKQQIREALRDYLLKTSQQSEGMTTYSRVALLQHRVEELKQTLPELLQIELSNIILSILSQSSKSSQTPTEKGGYNADNLYNS